MKEWWKQGAAVGFVWRAKSELDRQRTWAKVRATEWAEKLAREDNEDIPNTNICPRLNWSRTGLQFSRRRGRDLRWWGVENEHGGRDGK